MVKPLLQKKNARFTAPVPWNGLHPRAPKQAPAENQIPTPTLLFSSLRYALSVKVLQNPYQEQLSIRISKRSLAHAIMGSPISAANGQLQPVARRRKGVNELNLSGISPAS